MHSLDQNQRAHEERNHPLMQRAQRNPNRSGFSTLALIAGVVAAVAAAFVWGAIYLYLQREIVWAALGIGALVGGAIVLARGRGIPMAVAAAALAVAAIVGGKVIGVEWSIESLATDPETMEVYGYHMEDAEVFANMGDSPSNEEVENFLAEAGYQLSVADFRTTTAPLFLEWSTNPPTFEH